MQTITAKAPRTNSQSLMAPSYFASPALVFISNALRDEGEGSPAISSRCPRFLISEGTIFWTRVSPGGYRRSAPCNLKVHSSGWQRLARKTLPTAAAPCRISELIAVAVRNTRTIFPAARMAYHKAGSGSHQLNSFTRDEVQRIAANIADCGRPVQGWVPPTPLTGRPYIVAMLRTRNSWHRRHVMKLAHSSTPSGPQRVFSDADDHRENSQDEQQNPHGDPRNDPLFITSASVLTHLRYTSFLGHITYLRYSLYRLRRLGRTNEERQGLQKRKGSLNLTAASVWEEEVC